MPPARHISAAHITRFHIQRMQAGRGVFHASGGTTFARIAECGQAATQCYIGYRVPLSRWGSLRRYCVFPARSAHRPGAVWRQRRNGEASPSPASIAAVTVFTKSGAARKPLAVDWRCADLPVATELLYGFTRQRQSLPVAFHQILALLL